MLVFKWFSVLALAAVAYAEVEQPTELVIDTTYLPEDCPIKSQKGDQLSVHYTGKLWTTGEVFDSSVPRGQPFSVKLGAGQVIRGWDQGLVGMCAKEKRTLTIPSTMAYGSRGAGGKIPGGATLVFDVELLSLTANGPREEL